jgi:16S rRNA (guanine527-N7)-methyltransferase
MFHVKHQNVEYGSELLLSLCAAMGLAITVPQAALLLRHLEWLLKTNGKLNLTSVTEPLDALRLHVLDSLSALPEAVEAPDGPLLDIGTGGGFPGVPLSIVSGRRAVLLESVKKKAVELSRFAETSLPGVTVFGLRSEEYSVETGHQFPLVVVRAVSSLPGLVELATPLLEPSGRLVCLQGRPDSEEIRRASEVADLLGLEMMSTRTLQLPRGGEERTIFVYCRVADPGIALPRRPGMAQKRPLA